MSEHSDSSALDRAKAAYEALSLHDRAVFRQWQRSIEWLPEAELEREKKSEQANADRHSDRIGREHAELQRRNEEEMRIANARVLAERRSKKRRSLSDPDYDEEAEPTPSDGMEDRRIRKFVELQKRNEETMRIANARVLTERRSKKRRSLSDPDYDEEA